MAKAIHTTRSGATEDLPHQDSFTDTTMSTMFSRLLDALARHIQAERDIEDIDMWDLAYRDWLSDAEIAFTDVATLLSSIQRERPVRVGDLVLQDAVRLIDAMIGSEEPGMFQRLHFLLPRLHGQFHWLGAGAAAEPVRQMLMAARNLIEELSTLPIYAEADEDEDDTDNPVSEPCDQLAACPGGLSKAITTAYRRQSHLLDHATNHSQPSGFSAWLLPSRSYCVTRAGPGGSGI